MVGYDNNNFNANQDIPLRCSHIILQLCVFLTEIRQFVLRLVLIRDGDVLKAFHARFPAMVTDGQMVGAEVDFGDLVNDQEITFKVTIAIYSYI